MLFLISLWVLSCFLYGTFLWVKSFLKKTIYRNHLMPLSVSWFKFFLVCIGFFFSQLIAQQFALPFTHQIKNETERTLLLSFISEIALFLFVCLAIINNSQFYKGLQTSKLHFKLKIKFSFEGYCKVLPALLVITNAWEYILKILSSYGLPLTIDPQPIVQLLSQKNFSNISIYTTGISVILLAPFCEEIFFRGVLLRFIHSFLPLNRSLWISSIIFACAHQHFATFLPLLFLGYWLGLYYAKTGNIWVNIGIHSLFNGTNYLLIFLLKAYEFVPYHP